jgi:DNA-binding HxlR family transcriptional regulator
LNDRLRELRDSPLIDLTRPEGYGLTVLGRDPITVLLPLVEWSARWAPAMPVDGPRRRTAR